VGATIGPLIAFAMLQWLKLDMRTVFLIAAIPAALAVIALLWGVREAPRVNLTDAATSNAERRTSNAAAAERRTPDATHRSTPATTTPLGRPFFRYLTVLAIFTLGNSTDAFLLLRASELGVATPAIPLLWALLHVVKAGTSVPGGILSDRVGRVPLIGAGWAVYAAVYLGFGVATTAWHAWALFAAYGVFYGLTEGVEKALVADLVPAGARGRAFGWYNMALGLAVLPAALVFGWIWDARGSLTAFAFGAAIAGASAVALPFAVGQRPISGR
jgi:MFS family permease